MDKKKPKKTVLGRDIFLLFLAYPLKILPVIEKKKIITFLDKSKVFSMQGIDYFLDEPIKRESLIKYCYAEKEETFWAQLKEKEIQKIPLVVVKNKKISVFHIAERELFFYFNPIKNLAKDHFEKLFYSLPVALVVYNCFLTPLFINQAAKKILQEIDILSEDWGEKTSITSKKSLFDETEEWIKSAQKAGETFIAPLNDFQKQRTKKVYQHTTNKKIIKITTEKVAIEKKMVWVLYFWEQDA